MSVSGDSPSESSSQEPPGFKRQACHAVGRDLSGEDIVPKTEHIEGRNLNSVGKKANTRVMSSYAEDFAIEKDQVIAAMSAKHKATKRRKEERMRKKEKRCFKRKTSNVVSEMDVRATRVHKKQKKASKDEEAHEVNVTNHLEEARSSPALGKQLGLYAEDKNEVIAALAKGKDLMNVEAQSHIRKRRKGKRKN